LTGLKDKIENALNEGRILILGSQVLLGFQYRAIFEPGFKELPLETRYLKAGGLGFMLIAFGLLVSIGAYHQILEEGNNSERLHRYAIEIIEMALLPFAMGFGIDFYIIGEKLAGRPLGIGLGLAVALTALFFWYGLEAIARAKKGSKETRGRLPMAKKNEPEKTELKDKIKHVLTEARMVLPGAQTLLGFQFVIFLMESFDQIPDSSKYLHLASLGCTAVSIILLMTPAAYHRMVEEGENTEHFHRFASRMVVAAMVPLALGLSGDFFVVIRQVTDSPPLALIGMLLLLAFFYGLWFGFTLYRKRRRPIRSIQGER